MPLADRAQRILAVGDALHVLLEHLAQHGDTRVGATEVLLSPVGHRALADPGHDVLALDVVGDEAALIVAPEVFVDHRTILALPHTGVGGVVGIEELPRGGVVDGYADLHLVDAGPAHAHEVGEDQGVSDLPVVVVLRAALEDTTLEDSPLHLLEARAQVLLLEGLGSIEALGLTHEVEVVAVEPLDVVRIHGVLHDLQPVARQGCVAAVLDAIHDEDIETGQLRRGIRPDVDPDHAAHDLGLAGLLLHTVAEVLVVRLRRLFDAVALEVPLPPVVAAPDAVLMHDSVGQRGAAVRAVLGNDAVAPGLRRLEERPVLTEQAHGFGGDRVEVLLKGDGIPVAPQQLPHGRARSDLGEFFVLLDGQHVRSFRDFRCLEGTGPCG